MVPSDRMTVDIGAALGRVICETSELDQMRLVAKHEGNEYGGNVAIGPVNHRVTVSAHVRGNILSIGVRSMDEYTGVLEGQELHNPPDVTIMSVRQYEVDG